VISGSTKGKLDLHLNDDIDRRAQPPRGSKPPVAHRSHCPVLEAKAETAQYFNVSDAAVGLDHDLENYAARYTSLAGVFRILSLHFTKKSWRFDAAARSIRPAADAPSSAVIDAWPDSRPRSVGFWSRWLLVP